MMKSEIIEIKEDIRMPGTSIILEKGDKIKILNNKIKIKEAIKPNDDVLNEFYDYIDDYLISVIEDVVKSFDNRLISKGRNYALSEPEIQYLDNIIKEIVDFINRLTQNR